MKKSYGPAYLPTNIKAPSWLITLFVEPRAIEHVPLHTICCIALKGLPLFMP